MSGITYFIKGRVVEGAQFSVSGEFIFVFTLDNF